MHSLLYELSLLFDEGINFARNSHKLINVLADESIKVSNGLCDLAARSRG